MALFSPGDVGYFGSRVMSLVKGAISLGAWLADSPTNLDLVGGCSITFPYFPVTFPCFIWDLVRGFPSI
jgi:hypothetical protein